MIGNEALTSATPEFYIESHLVIGQAQVCAVLLAFAHLLRQFQSTPQSLGLLRWFGFGIGGLSLRAFRRRSETGRGISWSGFSVLC